MQYHRIERELKSSVLDQINCNGIFYSTDVSFDNEFNYRSIYSIKYQISGNEYYIVNDHKFFIQPEHYIIVNNDSDVSLQPTKNSEKAISIFIEPMFLNDVFTNQIKKDEELLADPSIKKEFINFAPNYYIIENNFISRILKNLAAGFSNGRLNNNSFSSSFFYHLARALLISGGESKKQFLNLAAVKYSTRIELHQRMIKAKEFIIDNWHTRIKMETVAEYVNMSPYHFQRTFNSVFSISPGKYHIISRLNKSRDLIRSGKYTVSEVALLVGYDDIYSFSKEFKKHFGFPPSVLK